MCIRGLLEKCYILANAQSIFVNNKRFYQFCFNLIVRLLLSMSVNLALVAVLNYQRFELLDDDEHCIYPHF